jgi:hypothetical protein
VTEHEPGDEVRRRLEPDGAAVLPPDAREELVERRAHRLLELEAVERRPIGLSGGALPDEALPVHRLELKVR